MQGWFNKQKLANVIHHIKQMKGGGINDHFYAEKASEKIQNAFIKTLQKVDIEGT